MTQAIPLSGLSEAPNHGCRVEVDEYVPLRFRTYEGALGGKYVRVGNFSGSLLEFLLDPQSLTIRGITLTSFDAVHLPAGDTKLPRTAGLPIVALSGHFDGPRDAQRIDIEEGFSVAFGSDFVEVDFGGLSGADRIIVADAVEFYVGTGGLLGVRVIRMTPQQISTIRAQRTA